MRKILLPTDGSELSERAVPVAEALARAQRAEVVVVRVVEPPAWSVAGQDGYVSPELYDQLTDALAEEAQGQVERLAARLNSAGVPARESLVHHTAAAGLLDFEKQTRPDLVVMATHGRTGLARFALGSVADRLVREGTAPVLLVRSFGDPTTQMDSALVPLDGSALSEGSLPMVEQLAGKPLRSVRLLRAVAIAEERDEASSYLARIAERLSALGLEMTTEVRVGHAARAIEAAAASAHMVILATHGRGGLDRMRHGSVAEEATRHLGIPVLLVRAGMAASASSEAVSTLAGAGRSA
jgi:nucleotide-binding universal stress UspA family protein